MKISVWITICAAIWCSCARAETERPSLFGFTVGDEEVTPKQDGFIPSSEDRDYVVYSRMSKNKEYLMQTLKLTRKTRTIAAIGAFSEHVPDGECRSKTAAVLAQLRRAHPDMKQKTTDVGPFIHYALSKPRPGCSYEVKIGRTLSVTCSSHFSVYCSSDGNGKSTLYLEAGDTGISELARREATESYLDRPDLLK